MTPTFDLEHVYDAEIAPRMAEIIAVCKKHGIPFLATFVYAADAEEGGADLCTSYLQPDGREQQNLADALAIVKRPATFAAFTITTRKAD